MRFGLKNGGPPKVLFIVHAWGGGTIRLACELAELISDRVSVIWAWGRDEKTLHVSSRNPHEPEYDFNLAAGLRRPLRLLRSFGIRRANIIHTIGLRQHVCALTRAMNAPYDVTFTDYHHFSERPHFEDAEGYFIGDEAVVEHQLAQRDRVSPLLLGAERLIAVSGDLAYRVQGFVPSMPVIPARVFEAQTITRERTYCPIRDDDEPLRVLILGRPHPAKGLGVLVDVADRIERAGLQVEIYCLGESNPILDARLDPFPCVKILGAYDADKLPSIVSEIRPHLAWFPFTQPETHSYALSDVLRFGLPILATAIGAVPERLINRPATWLIPYDRSMAESHFQWIKKLYDTKLQCEPSWQDISHLPDVDKTFFPDGYLQPILEPRPGVMSRLLGTRKA